MYIGDLRQIVPENVDVAMFADDVSLFSSHPNKEIAEATIKPYNEGGGLGRHHKLTLNASKSEVAFFTNNSKEALWKPSLHLDGPPLNKT